MKALGMGGISKSRVGTLREEPDEEDHNHSSKLSDS